MKRIVFALLATVIATGAFAQNQAPGAEKTQEAVKFKELAHDFGKIKQGVPVTFDFAFANTTDKPIVIESATPSCGCTTPVYPQTPIAKGKSDKITAGFNAAVAGAFNKTITIKVAGVEKPIEIRITGEVLNAEAYAKYEKEKGEKKSK